jgi:cellulose biosynthesis protein BcsQ
MTAAEVGLMQGAARERALADELAAQSSAYEIILLDCPPSLNMLTVNALVAADGVLIPIQCEYYALEGLSALLDTVEQIRASRNPRAAHRGHPAHHARPAQQPVESGLDAARDALQGAGLPQHRAAQRALAEAPSHGCRRCVRPEFARRHRLPRAGRRAAAPRRATRGTRPEGAGTVKNALALLESAADRQRATRRPFR